jgi:chemotaxis protein MotA
MIELATIIGLIGGFGMILSAFVMEGGKIGALLQITANMIVLGGTIGAVCVSFPLNELKNIPRILKMVFFAKSYNEEKVVTEILAFAEKARREGILTLEQETNRVENKLMRKGLRLVVDGVEPEILRDILDREIHLLELDSHTCASICEAAGGYSPTMGVIGTVMGLISVLGNLSKPEELGPSIALAFVATFYGVCLANLVYIPFATKIKRQGKKDKFISELIVEGLISIQEGQNPRIVKDRLSLVPVEQTDGTAST